MQAWRVSAAAIALAVIAALPSTAAACTGIRLVAGDGSIIYARTMEVGADLQSDMLIVPRGWQYVGETPDGAPGLRWTTRYGFVGPNIHGQPYVCDGLNEKGLAVGNFLFPGTAGYQKIEKARRRPRHRFVPGRRLSARHVRHGEEATAALEDVRVGLGRQGVRWIPSCSCTTPSTTPKATRRDRVRRRPAPRLREPAGRGHQFAHASIGT